MRRQLIIIGLTALFCTGIIKAVQPIDADTAALYCAVLGIGAFLFAGVLHLMKGKPA